jgi:hypothetical protein
MLNVSNPAYRQKMIPNTTVSLFALDHSDEHFTGTIQSADNQTIQLETRSLLQPGRRLVMNHQGCRTELYIISCREKEVGVYRLDCGISSFRKGAVRSDWRMPVDWPAHVRIPPAKNKYKARIRDMSVFGLGLEIEFEPEPDSLIIVSMRSGTGFGRVKHCRKIADAKYFVGLYLDEFIPEEQIDHESQWTGIPGRLIRMVSRAVSSVARLSWT